MRLPTLGDTHAPIAVCLLRGWMGVSSGVAGALEAELDSAASESSLEDVDTADDC